MEVADLGEKVVSQNVVQVGSLFRGLGQQIGDELLSLGREGGGQGVARLSDASVRLLQVGGFERGPAQQHGVPGGKQAARCLGGGSRPVLSRLNAKKIRNCLEIRQLMN